jgi:hypothetical protein
MVSPSGEADEDPPEEEDDDDEDEDDEPSDADEPPDESTGMGGADTSDRACGEEGVLGGVLGSDAATATAGSEAPPPATCATGAPHTPQNSAPSGSDSPQRTHRMSRRA